MLVPCAPRGSHPRPHAPCAQANLEELLGGALVRRAEGAGADATAARRLLRFAATKLGIAAAARLEGALVNHLALADRGAFECCIAGLAAELETGVIVVEGPCGAGCPAGSFLPLWPHPCP